MNPRDRRDEGLRRALAGEQPLRSRGAHDHILYSDNHCSCDLCQGKTPTFARPSAFRLHDPRLLIAALFCLGLLVGAGLFWWTHQ